MKQAPTFSCCATLCLVLASAQFCSAATWHVEDDSPGGDGTSWAQAFRYLQDALLVAQNGDEIRVAGGTYRPDERSDWPLGGTGDRAATFQLLNGVALRGGHAGLGAPNPDARDIDAYETILSGDLNEDDENGGFADNGYHVVTGSGTDETASVDGFTICSGNALPLPKDNGGGGMCNVSGSPTIICCTFRENQGDRGGALQNTLGSNPFFESCTFELNHGNYGGAVNSDSASAPIFNNCVFEQNSGDFGGGLNGGDTTLNNCVLSSNTGDQGGAISGGHFLIIDTVFQDNLASQGAAMWGGYPDTVMIRCRFERNVVTAQGGALWFLEANATLMYCTFVNNSAILGGAIWNNLVDNLTLIDCLFSGNSATQHGGAIASCCSEMSMHRCTFVNNSAGDTGGALYGESTEISFTNGIFIGNTAAEGGAIRSFAGGADLRNSVMIANEANNGSAVASTGAAVTLSNCSIVNNLSVAGAAVEALGIPAISDVHIANTILRNGGKEIADNWGISDFAVSYSNVQFGWPGIGNIDDDPQFESDGFHLRPGSPCINAGDPDFVPVPGETDIDGYPRVMGGRIDIGADEFTRRVLLLAEPAPITE